MITDFHSHILPACDHGSDSVETSKDQLKLLQSVGVKQVVATPHFYPHKESLSSFLKKREKCINELLTEINEIPIDIFIGAEVLLCRGLDAMDGLGKLCIAGTNTLLIEMPLTDHWESSLYDTLFKIADKGYYVVLAHADRYPFENISKLIAHPNVSIQLNSSKVLKFGGKKVLKEYLLTGKVKAFGSDIHMLNKKAVKSFEKLLKWASDYVEDVFSQTDSLLDKAERINNNTF